MSFEPWMLAAIDHAGYNGIRDAHIADVAQQILRAGTTENSRQDFDVACRHCGLDPENFTQTDLDRLQDYLNR